MGLRMKNLNIIGVHWKGWRGLGQSADLRGGMLGAVMLLRGFDTPMHTMYCYPSY